MIEIFDEEEDIDLHRLKMIKNTDSVDEDKKGDFVNWENNLQKEKHQLWKVLY